MNSIKKKIKITVVGLGYVGLPLLVLIASKGFNVIGYDISEKRINDIYNMNSLSFDYDKEILQKYINLGSLKLTSSPSSLKESNIIIVCVPTMIDENHKPITKHLLAATKTIKHFLTDNKIIIYESSTYPGCTRSLVSILNQSGLKAGTDFHVGFSPERIDPSNKRYQLKNIPKVISGLTPACTEKITNLYKEIFDEVFKVSSLETAEFMKLYENTYRFINIAYTNEMAIAAEKLGINIWEVIKAASTKPFGFSAFYPGPGVGGSCIPVNPWYMQFALKLNSLKSEVINTASKINTLMPKEIVNKILNIGSSAKDLRVLLVGVAYKKNVADYRLSPTIDIAKLLLNKDVSFKLYDPYFSEIVIKENRIEVCNKELSKHIKWANCVVLLTKHDCINFKEIAHSATQIIDTRGILAELDNSNIITLGKGV